MKFERKEAASDLSAQIASALRDAIISGHLRADDRLPSEAELAEDFNVSRPTVREALKRLAAQSLIRTQRGAFGGAFINRIAFEDAYGQHVTTSTLLLSMNAVSFDVACEARFAMERACAPYAASRRSADHLATMRAEIHRQSQPSLSDESWCASDVAFHRAFVDAAGNPVLSYQLAGSVEAMQPLMNMITFTARNRETIIAIHTELADHLDKGDALSVADKLNLLCNYTKTLAGNVIASKSNIKSQNSVKSVGKGI